MTDLHALALATWDRQYRQNTPPTRAEALAAVADAVEAAVRESIAETLEEKADDLEWDEDVG